MLKLIALIIPLGLDSFAIAAALGLVGLSRRERVRISLLFAAFEGGMPLIGLLLGGPLGSAIGGVADYVAIGVLIAFGAYTLLSGDEAEEEKVGQLAQTHGWAALVLGLTISLDELAIGFTIGLLRLPIVPVVLLIAVQAFVVSQLGLRLGSRVSERFREGVERLAGVALIALGVFLLVDKLFR